MHPPQNPQRRLRIPKWLVPAVAYTSAIASLFWVFHAFDYRQLEQDVRALHWGWVALGIVLNLAVYVVDAWRWAVLLCPAESVPVSECVKAVFVGQVANGVFPAKAGEIVRCYLLSFWTDTPLSLALTSDAIARVMDGICLVAGFYLVTAGLEVPRHLREKFALYLFLPVLSVWCLFRAYAFDFGLLQAGVVLIIIHIGTILPNAPANLGSFQVFATVALGLLHAEQTEAKIFSLILYFTHTLPQIAVGALVLLFTGLKLGEVHLHAKRAEHARKAPVGCDRQVP
jgi:uncharacterized membrane protein YbhN (UPF0104 family)